MKQTKEEFFEGRVRVLVDDITRQEVDAIVNAANSTLLGGGGVDGAIHRAGGPQIVEQCRQIRKTLYPDGLPTGEAVITAAGELPSQYVIHTVGPIYGRHKGQEAELLAACYLNSLTLAIKYSLKSIAFPAISTGAFGYPQHEAAAVVSDAINNFLSANDGIADLRLVFFGQGDAKTFLKHTKLRDKS